MNKALLLIPLLAACTTNPQLTIDQATVIAENELGFKAYEIKTASSREVQKLCKMHDAEGCTNHKVSLISNELKGCRRTEVIFHELMHQSQFIRQARTGIVSIKEQPAYFYGFAMSDKYCR